MADVLTSSDWDAAEEVNHVFERIGAVLVAAEHPGITGTLGRTSASGVKERER